MIQIKCAQCGGDYSVDSSPTFMQVHCPYCGTANSSRRQSVPVAQIADDGSSNRFLILMVILGGAGFFLLLMLAVGIFAWYSLQSKPQMAQQAPEARNGFAATPSDEAEQPKAAPVSPVKPIDRPAKPSSVPSNRTAQPTKGFASSGRMKPAFRYAFAKDNQYVYSITVKSSLNRQNLSVNGSVIYTAQEFGEKIKPEFKNDLPDQVKQLPNLMQVLCNTVSGLSTGTRLPRNQLSWAGDLICDDSGQVHKQSTSRFGRRGDEGYLLPLIYVAPEQVGFVDFPNDGSLNWSKKGVIQMVRVSASEATGPESAFDRIINRSRYRSPYGYSPPHYDPRSRSYPSPAYRQPSGLYGRSHDRYGRPIAEKKPLDVELTTVSVSTVTKYQFQSEDDSTLVLQRVIKGVPVGNSDIKITLDRTEVITFDKKQKLITKIDSTGETQMEINNVVLKLPIEYSAKLYKVKTADEVAEERLASKNRTDEVLSKSRPDSEARKRKAETVKLAAKENAAKYEHADFGDISWGLKSMAFTPNGRFLICGHLDRKISVYDSQRKRRVELQEKLEQLGQVVCIAVSPDGKFVLTGGYSGRIQIWKIDDSGLLDNVGQFVGHTSEIKSIAIDPTGQLVFSGESDKAARLWNLKTQKEIQAIREFDSGVYGTGFTEGGKVGVATCRENAIFIEAATGKITRKRKGYRNGVAHDIAFAPDGTEFAVADGYDIEVYETDTASKIKTLKGKAINWKLSYLSDGKHILSGEKAVCLWSTESASKVFELNVGDHVNVQAIAASPDGRFVCGNSRPLKLFNNPLFGSSTASPKKKDVVKSEGSGSGTITLPSAEELEKGSASEASSTIHCQFPDQGWGVDALCFSPDGKHLYAGKYGLQVYDVIKKRTIDNHDRFEAGSVTAIKASADGKHVLTALGSGVILVWKTDGRGQLKQIGKFVGHSSGVKSISIGPNSRWVVSGEKKRARIWDLATQKESLAVDFGKQVSSCSILPNGRAAIMSDGAGITVAKIPEMDVWKKFDKVGDGYGSHSAISQDGRKVAIANGYEIEVFDSTTGGTIASNMKAGETIWTLAFHPDGKHLLAGGRGKVMIWDTEKQTKVAELDVPTAYVQCLAISDDGKRIAAIPGSAGQTLTVFNSPVE